MAIGIRGAAIGIHGAVAFVATCRPEGGKGFTGDGVNFGVRNTGI